MIGIWALNFCIGASLALWSKSVKSDRGYRSAVSAEDRPDQWALSSEWLLAAKTTLVDLRKFDPWVKEMPLEKLDQLIEQMPPDFWTTNVNARPLLRAYFEQRFRGHPMEGLKAGLALLAKNEAMRKVPDAVAAVATGAFASGPPDSEELAALLPSLGEDDAIAVMKAYLDVSGFKTVPDAQTTIDRMVANCPLLNGAESRAHWVLRSRAMAIFFERGQDLPSIKALLAYAPNFIRNEDALAGFGRYAALHPEQAAALIKEFAALSPEDAGKFTSAANVPFDFSVLDGLDKASRGLYCRGFFGDARENGGKLEKFLDKVPFQALPESTARDAIAAGLRMCPGSLSDWLGNAPPEDEKAALDILIKDGNDSWYFGEKSETALPLLGLRISLRNFDPDRCKRLIGKAADNDLVGTLALIAKLPPDMQAKASDAAFVGALPRIARDDPAQLIQILPSLPEATAAEALRVAGEGIGLTDAQDPVAFAERLASPAQKIAFLQGMLAGNSDSLGREQYHAATEEFLRLGPTGDSAKEAIDNVAADYARNDPQSGAALVARLPPGELRDQAIKTFVEKWGDIDPEAAVEWIGQLPAGHERDVAVCRFVANAPDDLETGMLSATGITDPALRLETLKKLATAWSRLDPRRLEAALQSARVSPGDRAAMEGFGHE